MRRATLSRIGVLAVSILLATGLRVPESVAAKLDDMLLTQFRIDQLEYRATDGTDNVSWEADAWIGNDDHKLAFLTEGEKPVEGKLEKAEFQLLYRRPISDFFDGQIGVRHDIRPNPDRTYGVIGINGLAPYFFEADASLFIGEKGDVFARFEAEYDVLITQKLILQPAAELNLAFTEDKAIEVGRGVSTLEAGLRLRYEIEREFAPYVGLHWERKFGKTADFAREESEPVDSLLFVGGVRLWF